MSNENWENCFTDGLNTTRLLDVQFSSDPIYSSGPRATSFNISGDIGNQDALHGDVFFNYAAIIVDYKSDLKNSNPSYSFNVLPGQKQFFMEVDIPTHSSVLQKHVIIFNLVDLDENIGCVKFKRNNFTL
ncbi:2181_t:CDS:2 [Gigaspora margarita]|uniref:2181_t:CDS:1 n=1 Tax=Gigaspora margarita TaxID=4874 RepID=A0ABN7UBP9_GIGMA|nr:2181_t:CDS:2 [Gigaspora margarita]